MKRPAVMPLLTMFAVGLGLVGLCTTQGLAQQTETKSIGNIVTMQGTVAVTHSGTSQSVPANLRDKVFFRDYIETGMNSRTKALLIDDSIITLGDNSSIEITEHVFNPDTNSRSAIINLLAGKIRVLVGKTFKGIGSKFEVHTETASVAARGTYFLVWIEEPEARATHASYNPEQVQAGPTTGFGVIDGSISVSQPGNTSNNQNFGPGQTGSLGAGGAFGPIGTTITNLGFTNANRSTETQDATEPDASNTETLNRNGNGADNQINFAENQGGVSSGASVTGGGRSQGSSGGEDSGGDGGTSGPTTASDSGSSGDTTTTGGNSEVGSSSGGNTTASDVGTTDGASGTSPIGSTDSGQFAAATTTTTVTAPTIPTTAPIINGTVQQQGSNTMNFIDTGQTRQTRNIILRIAPQP